MRKFVAGTIVTAIAFYILTQFLPQYVSYEGAPVGLLVIAVDLRRRQRHDRTGHQGRGDRRSR